MSGNINLTIPNSSVYVSAIRAVAAVAAVEADLTIDAIEDSKLACNEALAILIHYSAHPQRSEWEWNISPKSVAVRVSAPLDHSNTRTPNIEIDMPLTWVVINYASHDLNIMVENDSLVITFTCREPVEP